MQVSDFFDDLYTAHERYWWRESNRYDTSPDAYPDSLLTQMTLRLLDGQIPGQAPGETPGQNSGQIQGRVLDLGAGEGADSIRLALLGYEVRAVEISTVAAEKIRRFAREAGVDVSVEVADIGTYEPEGSYDVIICNGVLHYIDDKESPIRRMQESTNPGGINVVSLWSTYTPVPECHEGVPVFCDDEDGVVIKSYQGWEIKLYYLDRIKVETSHLDMSQHYHSHIKMIAQKPLGAARR